MKVRIFNSFLFISALGVMIFSAFGSAIADTGGGRNYPATPWRREAPNSASDINVAKALAATYQTLSISARLVKEEWKDRNDLYDIWRVALVATPHRDGDKPLYRFAGKSCTREEVTISFSEIESFSVLSMDDETVTLSVTIWPDITAEELLEKQPTYKQLREGYRRDLVLTMGLKSSDGRPLAFAGEWDNAVQLEKIVAGTKGDFYAKHSRGVHPLRFWWAIPSVAEDKDYPFRLAPMKR
jgi:hypothetical protein